MKIVYHVKCLKPSKLKNIGCNGDVRHTNNFATLIVENMYAELNVMNFF